MQKYGVRFFALVGLVALLLAPAPFNPVAADDNFDVAVTVPATIAPSAAFTLTIKVTNKQIGPLTYAFNRVGVAYAPNDNLTLAGPYEIWAGTPTWTSAPPDNKLTTTISVPMQIITAKPGGSIIPLIVTLWENNYSTFRGGTATGVKLQK